MDPEISEIIAILRAKFVDLKSTYKIKEMAIFGSFARGEQKMESDIDIMIDTDEPLGLEFVDLAIELERLLGHKVDLVSKKGVKPKYLNAISDELIYV